MYKYLIIIPTYNEKDNISIILDKIINLKSISGSRSYNGYNFDILVVDDNSPDGTADIVEEFILSNSQIHIIKRSNKGGLGSAYIEGFKWAINNNYDYVMQIDADLSHNPDDLNRLKKKSIDYDLVIGSRYIKGISIVNWPLSRLILSYFANLYARIIIGIPIKDVTGGFKCISTKILKSINLNDIKSEGYSFQIELNYLAWINNYSIIEIPIVFTDRTKGTSKMSKIVILEAIYMVPYLFFKKIFKL